MRVKVLLFGPEAAATGRRELMVDLDPGATCAALKQALGRAEPALLPFLESGRIALNSNFADPADPVTPDDEVALIGMVSGG